MAKTKKTIEFTCDFAGKKKGETFTGDPMLCRSLVNRKKAIWTKEEDIKLQAKADKAAKKAETMSGKAEKKASKDTSDKKENDKARPSAPLERVPDDDLPPEVLEAIESAAKEETPKETKEEKPAE